MHRLYNWSRTWTRLLNSDTRLGWIHGQVWIYKKKEKNNEYKIYVRDMLSNISSIASVILIGIADKICSQFFYRKWNIQFSTYITLCIVEYFENVWFWVFRQPWFKQWVNSYLWAIEWTVHHKKVIFFCNSHNYIKKIRVSLSATSFKNVNQLVRAVLI